MENKAKEFNFEGLLESQGLSGEVSITVTEDALVLATPFDQLACLYPDIRSFAVADYALVFETGFGRLRLSRMGGALEGLCDRLWDAYNGAVQKALFVDGPPAFESRGEYLYEEAGRCSKGLASVRLFENCVCILPPNEEARRVPLCFARGMEEKDYSLRITLDTGEIYAFLRLGGYKEGFTYQLTKCLQALQKKSQAAIREICGELNSMQLTAIARLMPEGVAAPLGELSAISPAFVKAVERHIAQSRAAEPYAFFRKTCDPAEICVGLKPGKKREDALTTAEGEAGIDGEAEKSPYTIFIAAPKAGGGVAAVELAVPGEESAATFFYRYQGDWAAFTRRLNRAMEAVSFRREAVWLGENALMNPKNAHYRMAIQRTEALRFLRGCFSGRAIHVSPEGWQREVEKQFS